MKLRLRENSIRLRLLQSEIRMLDDAGYVSEEIRFSSQRALTYAIRISETIREIVARFENDVITVEVPKMLADKWIQTTLVGLENEQKIAENLSLKITLEKDFVCLDRPTDADNADAFPHPKTQC